MNEAQTEQDWIIPKLREQGWFDADTAAVLRQHPISQGALIGGGRRKPPLKADMVLKYKGRLLAIIEAKKLGD